MKYHILESLTVKGKRIPAGGRASMKGVSVSAIKMLIAKGRIAKVKGPPLDVIPGFKEYVADLAEGGVTDLIPFLEAEPSELVECLDMPAKEIAELQKDNEHWIAPPVAEEEVWLQLGVE